MQQLEKLIVQRLDVHQRVERPKKTWIEIVRNDLKTLNLTDKITLEQTEQKRKIHIASSTQLALTLNDDHDD